MASSTTLRKICRIERETRERGIRAGDLRKEEKSGRIDVAS